MSAVVAPLVHSRPRFAGCSLSPYAFSTVRRPSGPAPTSSTIPQPTPQYEQTVRTFSVAARGPDAAGPPPARTDTRAPLADD